MYPISGLLIKQLEPSKLPQISFYLTKHGLQTILHHRFTIHSSRYFRLVQTFYRKRMEKNALRGGKMGV